MEPMTVLPRQSRARADLPPELKDIQLWPDVDVTLIKDGKTRARFSRLRDAIELWLGGNSLADCTSQANTSVKNLYRIIDRCLSPHRDGQIWGLRALISGAQVMARKRTKDFDSNSTRKLSAGFSGMFSQTLQRYPLIADALKDALIRKGKRAVQPNKMVLHEIHKVFLEACRIAGLKPMDYPFNTVEKGRRALQHWINTIFLERYAVEYTRQTHGDSAANVMAHGAYEKGAVPDVAVTPYSEWQLDEYDVDLTSSFRFPAPYGDWDELELSRFCGLRVVDTSTGANLAEATVFAAAPQMQDVLDVLWLAISGQHRKERLLTPGLQYDEGGGFPSAEIPELKWVVPIVIRLDRALIHLTKNLQAWVKECWGGEVKFGRPYDPTERASVEARIGAQARRLEQQLPHTTYTGPDEARKRKKATDANVPFIEAPLLAEAIHVYCANENAHSMAGSGHIAPLVRLRRLIQSGSIHTAYLPQSRRKRHFFSQPIAVKIRVDLSRGRRPFFIFKSVRYSSTELQKRVSWKGKAMWIRPDHHDLRTLIVFKENGEEFDVARAQGRWGVIPHDARIRQMYQKFKRAGELGDMPQDGPLEALFRCLRIKANQGDKRSARSLAYVHEYLRLYPGDVGLPLQSSMEDLDAADRAADAPLVYVDTPPNGPVNRVRRSDKTDIPRAIVSSDAKPRRSIAI